MQYFGHVSHKQFHDYLGPKVKDSGLEVSDDTNFKMLKNHELVSLGQALESGEWGDGGHKAYYLKKKEKPSP